MRVRQTVFAPSVTVSFPSSAPQAGAPSAEAAAEVAADGAQLVLVFGSVARFDQPGFADGLATAFPRAVLAGCSTAGEIIGDGVLDESCTVTAVRFDRATVAVAEADIGSVDDSQPAGEALGRALAAVPDLSGVLLFAHGVAVNGSALIDGLVSCLPAGIPVSGGLAGDGGAFIRTLVLGPSGVSEARAVAGRLAPGAVLTSFYSYGEIGPMRDLADCRLHNQTMTVALLTER